MTDKKRTRNEFLPIRIQLFVDKTIIRIRLDNSILLRFYFINEIAKKKKNCKQRRQIRYLLCAMANNVSRPTFLWPKIYKTLHTQFVSGFLCVTINFRHSHLQEHC